MTKHALVLPSLSSLALLLAAACGPGSGAGDGGDAGPDAGPPPPAYETRIGNSFTLSDDRITLGTLDDSTAMAWRAGRLKVWNTDPTATAIVSWELTAPPGAPAPVVDELGRVYVSGMGQDFVGGGAFTGKAHLLALDPDGKVRWSFDGGVAAAPTTPAINGDRATFVLDGALIALDAGVEAWRDGSDTWNSTPLLLGTQVLVASAGGVSIFDATGTETFTALLDQHAGASTVPLLLADASTFWVIQRGSGGGVYAFDRTARTLRWFHPAPSGGSLSCPCDPGSDGRVFLLQAPGEGGATRELVALASADGFAIFSVASEGRVWGGTPAANGLGYLLVDGASPGLRALDGSGQVRWAMPGVQASPVVRGPDRIYVLNAKQALALDDDGTVRWSWDTPDSKYSNGMQLRLPPAASEGGLVLFAWWQNKAWPNNDQARIVALQDADL